MNPGRTRANFAADAWSRGHQASASLHHEPVAGADEPVRADREWAARDLVLDTRDHALFRRTGVLVRSDNAWSPRDVVSAAANLEPGAWDLSRVRADDARSLGAGAPSRAIHELPRADHELALPRHEPARAADAGRRTAGAWCGPDHAWCESEVAWGAQHLALSSLAAGTLGLPHQPLASFSTVHQEDAAKARGGGEGRGVAGEPRENAVAPAPSRLGAVILPSPGKPVATRRRASLTVTVCPAPCVAAPLCSRGGTANATGSWHAPGASILDDSSIGRSDLPLFVSRSAGVRSFHDRCIDALTTSRVSGALRGGRRR